MSSRAATKETKQLDLSSLDTIAACNRPFELELIHPTTKAGLGMFISVLGKDSDVFREHIRDKVNASIRQAAIDQKRGSDPAIKTVEQQENESIETLVLCTTNWRNIYFEGETLSFTKVNALKLYSALKFVRDQVDNAIGNLENFMQS